MYIFFIIEPHKRCTNIILLGFISLFTTWIVYQCYLWRPEKRGARSCLFLLCHFHCKWNNSKKGGDWAMFLRMLIAFILHWKQVQFQTESTAAGGSQHSHSVSGRHTQLALTLSLAQLPWRGPWEFYPQGAFWACDLPWFRRSSACEAHQLDLCSTGKMVRWKFTTFSRSRPKFMTTSNWEQNQC